jgi:alpha-tubulin suppressor-like RCC1 family protein
VNYRSDVDALIEPSELHGATALALATDHGCALVDGGRVRCWGRNDSGQLGSGDFTPAPSGITLEGVQDMRQIAAGWSASCAVGREGDVLCWGYIDSERFSFGEYAEGAEWCKSGLCRVVPERVEGLPIVRQVVMGKEHACALGDDGNVYCWGSNRAGQLGDGTFQRSHTPRQVLALSDVTMLAAGRLHTCALRENGSLLCWGDDEHGQLGAGPERAPYLCISQWGVHYRCSNEPLPVLGLSR